MMPASALAVLLVCAAGVHAAADPKAENPFLGLGITVSILSDKGVAEERLKFAKDEVVFANGVTGVGSLPYTRSLLNNKPSFSATTGEGARMLTWRGTLEKGNGRDKPDHLEGTIEMVAGEAPRKLLTFTSKKVTVGADGKPVVMSTTAFEGKSFAIEIMNAEKAVIADRLAFKDGIAECAFSASLGFAATFAYQSSLVNNKATFSGAPPEAKGASLNWRGAIERIDNVDTISGSIEFIAADNSRKIFTFASKGLLGPDGRPLDRTFAGKSYTVEITDVKGRTWTDRVAFARGLLSARTNGDFGLGDLAYTVTGKQFLATGSDAAGNSVEWKGQVDKDALTGFITISPKSGDKQRWSFAPPKAAGAPKK